MKSVALEISDVKSEFEGGVSFSLDWYGLLRQAAEVVIENLNPESLKRVVPIYGGLTNHLQVYYCPPDVRVPSRIYSNDGRYSFDYIATGQYWKHKNWLNKFTIETVNGVRFLVIKHPVAGGIVTLDPMDDPTNWTSQTGVSLVQNNYNVMPGSTNSLQGVFSDTLIDIDKILDAPVDISEMYANGVLTLPFYIDSALSLDVTQGVTIGLLDGNGNSLVMTTLQDSIGDFIRDGQNVLRFWLQNKQIDGDFDPTNVTQLIISPVMKAGTSATVIFGKPTVQTNHLFFFEYYSDRMFVDGVTGSWKDTPVKGDSINLSGGALNVFHFEACRITVRKTKTERVDGAEGSRMDTELARAYGNYYKDFPSSAEPVSYNISPNIAHGLDVWGDNTFFDIPDSVGFNQSGNDAAIGTLFADGEVPGGLLNGTNQIFTLAHTPAPAESLLLVFNGEVLMEGIGFSIAGRTVTLLAPYYTITNVGFIASYRYYAGT